MNTSLFAEFDSVSAKEWKQKIQVGLKGAEYNDTLVWQSLEGINVKPFYHRDDLYSEIQSIPGTPSSWAVVQSLFIDDIEISTNLAIDSLHRGAESLFLKADKVFDISKLFESVPLKNVTLYFELNFLDAAFTEELIQYFKAREVDVHYRIDLIQRLTKDGNWFHSMEKDHGILETLVSKYPNNQLLGIDTSGYQNAGANSIQQLAYGLAHANEYLNHFRSHFENNPPTLTFTIAIGSNYFFEIAKIRALRWLVASLAEAYNFDIECHILAIPSKRNKTLYDYNVNMLRTTTECMSAVLGGADSVMNISYDTLYHKSNEFGERISRNQLLILKSEAYFDWVTNPVEGSYFVEKLTEELAEKALALFKNIEGGGGFLKNLKDGIIQRKISESAKKEQQWFDKGKLILVGSNKYPNSEDRMKEELELYPFLKQKPRKTIIQPVIEKRLAEKIEKERLTHEA